VSSTAYGLIGLTALLTLLVAILLFAVLRFASAAKDARRRLREGGERAFVSGALQEALERVKAQERAMSARAVASEQLSDLIVSSLTAGLMVVSSSGRIVILNPAGRQLLSVAPGPLPDHYNDIAGAAPLAAVLEESFASGQPIVRRAVQIAGPSGPIHLGVTVSPLAREGESNSAICLFSDLTAVVDLEEQLRLKDALAQLGELTAGIAHEFRNGLATIHGYGRLIDPAAVPPNYRPYVEGIRAETEALGQVVTNFLNFAKPEQMAMHEVDIGRLLQRTVDDTINEIGSRGTVTLEGTFAVVQGDDVLLRQAFSNLLRNAIEACEGAGITPRVSVVGALASPRQLRVSVNDNGPGVDPAVASRVFRPFFTTKGRGTGLGLAIVQKVIVSHNGRVSLAAAQNGGASFQVTLPIEAHVVENSTTT
jgi:two-component system, NtrC family, sensor histidine kinase PilS